MAEVVGGLWLTQYSMTRSFGIEPGSATGQGVLAAGEIDPGLAVGDYIVYSFAGNTFHGLLSSLRVGNELRSGKQWSFSMVDNRIRLRWMLCLGQWNTQEDRSMIHARVLPRPPDGEFSSGGLTGDEGADFGAGITLPPAALGSDTDDPSPTRSRVYGHIVPSQWRVQLKSYTDAPVSGADIIRSAAKAALGGYGFAFNFHSGQSKPVFDVDANSGMSMAALLETVGSAQGLQVTLDGARTLRWERRGEGTLVIPPPPVHLRDDGTAMSAEPTKVMVIGDRTLVQVNNITLEPDWKSGWEPFVSEAAWLDEVKTLFSVDTSTSAGQADLAALSREVTMAKYIRAKEADPLLFADYGTWDLVSRLNMPVWKYLNDIVYRSYRISKDDQVFGLPMRSLEIHDSLLCAVELDPGEEPDSIVYRAEPHEFYPQASAHVIAKGQPIDMLNFADREELTRIRTFNPNENWSEVHDFTLDAASHSIRFNTAIFKDGDPSQPTSLLLFPNNGQGGYEDVSASVAAESDWLRIVVPNPAFVITPAEVKCSLVFRLGKFNKAYGTGQRWTGANVPNIAWHLLMRSPGDSFSPPAGIAAFAGDLGTPSGPPGGHLLGEMLYEDGKTAEELAEEQAEGIIQRSGIERSGGYTRHGSAGTSVSGVIDRVTVDMDWQGGVKETVEFSKPRTSSAFVSGKDFARRVVTEELFSGQKELDREIRELRGIARLERASSRNEVRKTANRVITDMFRRPPGGENPTVKTHMDVNAQFPPDRGEGVQWRAGDLMWLDDAGLPSQTGSQLAGVVVMDSVSEAVVVATSGMVPASVAPGTSPSSSLVAEPGQWFASNTGSYPIGMLAHGSPAPGTGEAVIGLVKLGAGGGGASGPCHFGEIIEDGEDTVLRGGVLQGGDGNKNVAHFPIDLGTDAELLVWLEVGITANTEDGVLMPHLETCDDPTWETGTVAGGYPDNTAPDIVTGVGIRIVPLGVLTVAAGAATFDRTGCGDITLGFCPPNNLSITRG